MNAIKYQGAWISTDTYLIQSHRDENAKLIGNELYKAHGWTMQAIAGMLGNADVESSMNPALIQGRDYPNLIDNYDALILPESKGIGLLQWTGNTDTPPVGQKLASFAIRRNQNWYDWRLQNDRLEAEWENDLQFEHMEVEGQWWEWRTYTISTESPELLAKVWQYCYERGGTDTERRQAKARYYYNLLNRIPVWYLAAFAKKKEGKPQCLRI